MTRSHTNYLTSPPLSDPGIPPLLLAVINLPAGAPLHRALQRKSLRSYPLTVYQAVLDDLDHLTSECISRHFTTEACFLESVALEVQNERAERLVSRGMTEETIDRILAGKTEQLYCCMRKLLLFLTPDGRTLRRSSRRGGSPN
jgi:hypothetical protein